MIRAETLALASATTGFLLVRDIGRVYSVIEQFFGYAPYTHQLPRLGRELAAHVERHIQDWPTSAVAAAYPVNPDTFERFGKEIVARWGETLDVPALAEATPETDPVEELATMMAGKPVVVVPLEKSQ